MLVAAAFTAIVPAAIAAAPVARAGESFMAYPGERITLNGAASSDPDGDPLAYTWRQVGGLEVELADTDGPKPSFTPARGATYSFELVVSDATRNSPPDRVDVVVVEPAVGERLDTGGCSAAPAAGGLALVVLALAARRRS